MASKEFVLETMKKHLSAYHKKHHSGEYKEDAEEAKEGKAPKGRKMSGAALVKMMKKAGHSEDEAKFAGKNFKVHRKGGDLHYEEM